MRVKPWIRLATVLLAILLLAVAPARPGRAADPPPPIFLPLVMKPAMGISGRITQWGEPVDGVEICLGVICEYNTLTDPGGHYFFPYPSSWQPGVPYQIYYVNPSRHPDGRILWLFSETRIFSGFENVSLPDIDIADIFPLSPVTESTITLPTTFHWQKPPRQAGGSYQINFWDYDGTFDQPTWNFYTPSLGDVDTYVMTQLLDEMPPNHHYWWHVYVSGPDGSISQGYFHSTVLISDGSSAANSFLPPDLRPDALSLMSYILRWTRP